MSDRFQFMPGLAAGDVAGGGCGEPGRVRGDTDAAEVQTVGIEADGDSGFRLRAGTVMDLACGDEELHAGVVELEVPGLAELQGQLRAAASVLRIMEFILPTGVMEQREKPDDLLVRRVMPAEIEAVSQDRAPVAWAVVGMGAEAEPGGDELPERKFGRGNHNVEVG